MRSQRLPLPPELPSQCHGSFSASPSQPSVGGGGDSERAGPPTRTMACRRQWRMVPSALLEGNAKSPDCILLVEDRAEPPGGRHGRPCPPGGAVDQNGPVIVTLVKTGTDVRTVPVGTTLTDAQYKAYLDGQFYVNVHSDSNMDERFEPSSGRRGSHGHLACSKACSRAPASWPALAPAPWPPRLRAARDKGLGLSHEHSPLHAGKPTAACVRPARARAATISFATLTAASTGSTTDWSRFRPAAPAVSAATMRRQSPR